MVGVLAMLAQRSGLEGVWLAGLLAGIFLIGLGALKLGRLIAFIPAPVITGFTSGVALTLMIGQIDNFLGAQTPGAETSLGKLLGYFQGGYALNGQAALIAAGVVAVGVVWPKSWSKHFPASLAGLILATGFNAVAQWPVAQIGAIPQTLLLPERLTLEIITWNNLSSVLGSAVSIALLCGMEALLCGAVMSDVSGIRFNANRELISQGVGNLILPFFGGIPATATMVRSSVMVKSGGQTRVAGLVKGVGLLLTMAVLAPVMSRVPMSALAGVLMVTAWRMNKWATIRSYFSHRYTSAIIVYTATIAVTVATDLVVGLLAGIVVAILVYLGQSARLEVTMAPFDSVEIQAEIAQAHLTEPVRVARVAGQLFFATANGLTDRLGDLSDVRTVILCMNGLTLVDASGLEALSKLADKLKAQDATLFFVGVTPAVRQSMVEGGLEAKLAADHILSDPAQASLPAD